MLDAEFLTHWFEGIPAFIMDDEEDDEPDDEPDDDDFEEDE